jgi:VCBS repeat-containing protein
VVLVPELAAADDAAAALDGGPAVTGDVLANDAGAGLVVTAVGGDPAAVGQPLAGALGVLTLAADGGFAYVASAARHLPAGVTAEDVFAYRVTDAAGASATAELRIAVSGANDAAAIAGDTAASLLADAAAGVAGVLTVTDPDTGEAVFRVPASAALRGDFGIFAFDAATGAWSYALDPGAPALVGLAPGASGADRLSVTSLDGTASETVTVTVTAPEPLPEPPPVVALSGRVQDRAGREIEGVGVTFTPADGPERAAVSDAGGRFALELEPGAAGALELTLGWSPGSPAITTASALEALRLAVGLTPSWGAARAQDFIAADLDGDGRVTAADALGILRSAVGLGGGPRPHWVFVDAGDPLDGIGRNDVSYRSGVEFAGLEADHGVEMTGILVGQLLAFT